MRVLQCLAPISGLVFLSCASTQAQSSYTIRPVFAAEETVGGIRVGPAPYGGALGESGEFVFIPSVTGSQSLLHYADGRFTGLVVPGQDCPGGKWPTESDTRAPAINGRGTVVFAATATIASTTGWGVFRWDPRSRTTFSVMQTGMPAVNGLTFVPGVVPDYPVINDHDEVAFSLAVPNAVGKAERAAFFLGRDERLLPVAVPGQILPGGRAVLRFAGDLSLNDAGVVAVRVQRQGDASGNTSAYLYENDVFTPVAVAGETAPGGGTIARVSAVYVNNLDRSALVAASESDRPGRAGLYRFSEGRLSPVILPGQELPGGARLSTIPVTLFGSTGIQSASREISRANASGQHVFIAQLEGGGQALYRLERNGDLTLILRTGAVTEMGKINGITTGWGLSFNSRGQIAVTLRIAGRPETTVLLTPNSP